MKTRDSIHKDILGKQGDETNAKYREVTLKDTPTSSNNIKESQQTLFLREDENKLRAKITVHTTEEAMTTNKEGPPVSVKCCYDNAWSFYILDFLGALVMSLIPFTLDWFFGLDVLT